MPMARMVRYDCADGSRSVSHEYRDIPDLQPLGAFAQRVDAATGLSLPLQIALCREHSYHQQSDDPGLACALHGTCDAASA
jgi:hypothetical protein